jgi:YD repeat-containing protein
MVCPACNAEVGAGAAKCPRCGYLLAGGAQSYGAGVDSHSANAQSIVLILIATLGAMVCVLVVFMVVLYAAHVRGCPAMADAVAVVEESAEARAALGEPIRTDWWVTGAVRDDREAGFALLTILLHGSKTSGKLTVVANRVGARWDLESVALRVNGQRLDLSPATQRETFNYPPEGRVYLLPMDEDAAVMLGDFPGYFKARLGIDVTILPMLSLVDERLNVGAPGAATAPAKVSAAAGQVSAEKVIDYMLREKPEILAELDSALIGVTSRDMTIESYGWRFATAYRRDGRFAIISTNRLHDVPWYAGENPDVFPVRVRKVVLKNIALLHYPLDLSADPTSALAAGITSGADTDAMGENLLGESGAWQSSRDPAPPCVTITRGPGGRQAWRIDCNDRAPNDSRYELFENYTQIPLFIQARTDLPFGGEYPLPFTRVYRPKDPASREFGIGATHSLGMMLYSEKAGTSDVDLCLADGARVAFHAADGVAGTLSSLGQAKQDGAQAQAVLKSRAESGRFSLATLTWTGNDWRLKTLDGWTYQFMSNGVNHPGHEGVLTGIEVAPDEGFRFAWTGGFGKALRVEAPDHSWMEMEYDGQRRIRESRSSTGRVVDYEYDSGGRLASVRDAENGDERYEYDAKSQMTAVLDSHGRALLKNTYNDAGDIVEQVLADGRKLAYEYRRDERGAIEWMKFTDPLGYAVEWTRCGNGYYTRTLPVMPRK